MGIGVVDVTAKGGDVGNTITEAMRKTAREIVQYVQESVTDAEWSRRALRRLTVEHVAQTLAASSPPSGPERGDAPTPSQSPIGSRPVAWRWRGESADAWGYTQCKETADALYDRDFIVEPLFTKESPDA